jgi:hypothetical protein
MTNPHKLLPSLLLAAALTVAAMTPAPATTYWWHLGRSSPQVVNPDICEEPDEVFDSPAGYYERVRISTVGRNLTIMDDTYLGEVNVEYTNEVGDRVAVMFFRTKAGCESMANIFRDWNRKEAAKVDRNR